MKKLFTALLLTFLFSTSIWAIDTIRVCPTGIQGFINTVTPPINIFCPSIFPLPPFLGNGIGILNGDTVYQGQPIPIGTEGIINVHCYINGQPPGTVPDTSYYLIAVGKPLICAISSDANNHPVIYIDSSTLPGNKSVLLQRQFTTNSWQTVATISLNDTLVVTDISANTASQSYNYRVFGGETNCGSTSVTTMHLQSNGNNLSWNSGGGVGLDGYYIYKKDAMGVFVKIDSTPKLTYTDLNFQNGDEYFVEALKPGGCQSTAWRSSGNPLSVKSNRIKINTSSIKTVSEIPKYYVIGNMLNVSLNEPSEIIVSDITGRVIERTFDNRLEIQLPTKGLFVLNVDGMAFKVITN